MKDRKIVVLEEVISFIKENGGTVVHGPEGLYMLQVPKILLIQNLKSYKESQRLERGEVFEVYTEEEVNSAKGLNFLKYLSEGATEVW